MCLDLAAQALDEDLVASAELVAFHLPMHTATRIAARVARRVRTLNPTAHICFYGLYAPMNEPYLRQLGAGTVLGGEFEAGLVSLVRRLRACRTPSQQPEPVVSTARLAFQVPDRGGLPPLTRYARLVTGDGSSRTVGYTEASRGCKHLCRHCPVVPVYQGRFRVVPREVVLEDVARQVAAGAEHVTFGDPDFFNGVGHARALVRELHRRHPALTYDVTIKIEHLLRHARELPLLRETGCVLVTTAVESVDDRVLMILEKGHTRDDFVRAVQICRSAGITLNPTFVAFTPWISLEGYRDLLSVVAGLELVDHVSPVQLSIRLLIPAGSRLLELGEVRDLVQPFDAEALCWPWRHPDPRVDGLHGDVRQLVASGTAAGATRHEIFGSIMARVEESAPIPTPRPANERPARVTIPYLTEPWYC